MVSKLFSFLPSVDPCKCPYPCLRYHFPCARLSSAVEACGRVASGTVSKVAFVL
jgi:hypothetical protein